MTSRVLRVAGPDDAEVVAVLHAESWRRHYRGAYADSYLDGDVVADRRSLWSSRLAAPGNSVTVIAEESARPVGFVHMVFDNDRQWGSLVDNLHVIPNRQRSGVGTALLTRVAGDVSERANGKSMYLWVLEQNAVAQEFYRAVGGTCVERAPVPSPGGVPGRLTGTPHCLRFVWPDVAAMARRSG
jgi:ribosomal protein S18 acetylase RimI-like enzyme